MKTLPENYDEFISPFGGSVRVIMIDGEPWFFAKDVCDILSTAVSDIRKILDTDEVMEFSNMDTIHVGSNGGRAPLIVSEPGLYSLVLKSRKEEAKTFKRWVTHEVLPSIRKKGMYGGPKTLQESLRAYADILDMNERNKRLAIEAQAKVAQLADSLVSTEAQRDKAIRERAWINSSRAGRCMGKVRIANNERRKVEAENVELKIQLGNAEDWKTVAAMQKELGKVFTLSSRACREIGHYMAYVSKKIGKEIKKVADARYGQVNAYHKDAWKVFLSLIKQPHNAMILACYRKKPIRPWD